MTPIQETALRNEWCNHFDEHAIPVVAEFRDMALEFWLAKMKARESEEKDRIDSRLAYMFANAPETYHAIKQIIYS